MTAAARLTVDGEILALAGELRLAGAGREAIRDVRGDAAVLDLSGVRTCDSAGLALVVDWLRAARRRDLRLSIRGAPQQLVHLAQVSGLEDIISGEGKGAA